MVYKKQNVQYFYISIDLYCFKCTRDEYRFVCADVMKTLSISRYANEFL